MFAFWLFMVGMTLHLPLILIPFGRRFMKRPPKKINHAYGYRTRRSMKNDETCEFAHRFWGRKVYVFGLISILMAIVPMLFVINTSIDVIAWFGLAVMTVVMVFDLVPPVVMTENALKTAFDEDENRTEDYESYS